MTETTTALPPASKVLEGSSAAAARPSSALTGWLRTIYATVCLCGTLVAFVFMVFAITSHQWMYSYTATPGVSGIGATVDIDRWYDLSPFWGNCTCVTTHTSYCVEIADGFESSAYLSVTVLVGEALLVLVLAYELGLYGPYGGSHTFTRIQLILALVTLGTAILSIFSWLSVFFIEHCGDPSVSSLGQMSIGWPFYLRCGETAFLLLYVLYIVSQFSVPHRGPPAMPLLTVIVLLGVTITTTNSSGWMVASSASAGTSRITFLIGGSSSNSNSGGSGGVTTTTAVAATTTSTAPASAAGSSNVSTNGAPSSTSSSSGAGSSSSLLAPESVGLFSSCVCATTLQGGYCNNATSWLAAAVLGVIACVASLLTIFVALLRCVDSEGLTLKFANGGSAISLLLLIGAVAGFLYAMFNQTPCESGSAASSSSSSSSSTSSAVASAAAAIARRQSQLALSYRQGYASFMAYTAVAGQAIFLALNTLYTFHFDGIRKGASPDAAAAATAAVPDSSAAAASSSASKPLFIWFWWDELRDARTRAHEGRERDENDDDDEGESDAGSEEGEREAIAEEQQAVGEGGGPASSRGN